MAKRKRKKIQVKNQSQQSTIDYRNWFKKNWKTIISILFSLIAVAISVKSCKTADKAYETSKEQFFQQNKPHIVLQFIMYRNSNSFYENILSPEQNTVELQYQLEIRNIGNVAAKDLVIYDDLKAGKSIDDLKMLEVEGIKKVTLGPGEKIFWKIPLSRKYNNTESYNKYVQEVSSEKGTEMTVEVEATYSSEVNPKQSFRSVTCNKITKREASIIRMQYEEK